jgi:hypothetical protein
MPRRELRDLHERLRDELARGDAGDPESRAILAELHLDIEEALARGDEEHPPATLTERLRQRVEALERSHPDLVGYVDNVLRALAGVGL